MDSNEKFRLQALNKRAITIVLAVAVVLVACVFVIVQDANDYDATDRNEFRVDHLTYKVTSSIAREVEVSDFDNKIEDVVIPSTVTNKGVEYTVTAIGGKAFHQFDVLNKYIVITVNSAVETVSIPDTVKVIKKNAFYNTSLKSLTVPQTVELIEGGAFHNCDGLTELKILSDKTKLEKKSLVFGSLVNLTIPIGLDAVVGNTSVFGKTPDLVSITFTGGSGVGINYSSKNDSSDNNYVKTAWYQALSKKSLKITFEDGITHIGNNMFRGCKNIKDVELPYSVKSIGDNAFANTGLKAINLPDRMTSIGEGTFSGCVGLESIKIPDSVKQISARSFEGCKSLKNYVLHDGIAYIGDYAFKNCSMIDSIEFPSNIIQLGRSAFEKTGLVKLTIPASITVLYESTFKGCSNLKELKVPANLNTVVKNNNPAFEGCTSIEKVTFTMGTGYSYDYGDNQYTPWRISKCLKSVVFDDGVMTVGKNMFKGCKTLTDIYLPRSLTKIGANAFTDCTSLKSLVLIDITSIGNNAFKGCNKVSKVSFSADLGSIGKDAFKGFKFKDKDGKSISISAKNLKGKSFSGSDKNLVLI